MAKKRKKVNLLLQDRRVPGYGFLEPAFRAAAAGATLIQPAQDKFYGDRTGSVEDVPMKELKKRGEKAMKEMSS